MLELFSKREFLWKRFQCSNGAIYQAKVSVAFREENKDEICTGYGDNLGMEAIGLGSVTTIPDASFASIMKGNLVRDKYNVRDE